MNLLNRLQLSDSSYSGLEWHEVLRTSYAERQGPVKQAAILNRLQLADSSYSGTEWHEVLRTSYAERQKQKGPAVPAGRLSVSGMQVNLNLLYIYLYSSFTVCICGIRMALSFNVSGPLGQLERVHSATNRKRDFSQR